MDTRVYIFSKNLFVIFFIITSLLGCARNAKQFKIVEVILIQDRDGREHMFNRGLIEGKAMWCVTHEVYESVEVKRLQNQSNLIKAHAND